MIRLAIIEDNRAEADALITHLDHYAENKGVHLQIDCFSDGDEAVEKVKSGYDILFMDIELPLLCGMDAAEQIRRTDRDVTIIFVTSNPNYAIRGYKVEALDYILKPLSFETVAEVMDRALKHRQSRQKKYIPVRLRGGTVKLDISKIRYVDVLDHYVSYHMTDGEVTTKSSMREVAEQLEGEHFFQSSKAYLVNLAHVDGITGNDIVIGGEKIPVSRARKKAFLQAMSEYLSI